MRSIIYVLLCLLSVASLPAARVEESFLLVNGQTNGLMMQFGPHVEQRVTPCSTFKIALSLMGYDSGCLQDEHSPCWSFSEGYTDSFDAWKAPHTPRMWMKNSCVWYSQLLASHMGFERVQEYLSAFNYGNADLSGGIKSAWNSSTLKISPRGQVTFLRDMLRGRLPVSSETVEKTKRILLIEEMPDGWKLYGKTGLGMIHKRNGQSQQIGWFIGWIERDNAFFPFAYNIREDKVKTARRIPRVRQLLEKVRHRR